MRIWLSDERARFAVLMAIGLALIATGVLFDGVFPINKKIWTSSFSLLTSGLSFIVLLAATAIQRSGPLKNIGVPFASLGKNAILAFALSIILSFASSIPITGRDVPRNLQQLGMATANAIIPNPYLASLACAFLVLALIFIILWPLHRRAIHLRL